MSTMNRKLRTFPGLSVEELRHPSDAVRPTHLRPRTDPYEPETARS